MLWRLILLFTLVPFVELALLLWVGREIGVWSTLGLVIITGVIGASLAKLQGLGVLRQMGEEMARGILPAESLFDGLFVLAGGLLLLTPGFITDILGFIALLPPTRGMLKRWLQRKVKAKIRSGQVHVYTHRVWR